VGAIPARLGRYRLLEHLASGGMADVFRAKSVGIAGFEKILAIKLIRPNIAQEPRFIRSFIDEARIAVSLNHRNIVQVFDFGKAEHRLYLAMELIEGIDLRAALVAAEDTGYGIPLPIACYIVADLAAGLDYAHRKVDAEGRSLGIVHCDVSPHNVMLSDEGFIKILDFGVARAHFALTPEERRLRGKPRYMAPEQTLGDTPTPATDAFALGIIAWELFTGLRLFEGEDLAAVLGAVRRADAPPVHRLNPDVPRYLSEAIAAALAREPADRIGTGELSELAGRASRELATVASSRALADWLALIKPAPAPRAQTSSPDVVETPDETGTSAAFADDESRQLTRTNLVIAPVTSEGEVAAEVEHDERGPEPGTSGELPVAVGSGDLPRPIADLLLRERRHVVATCALLDGGDRELRAELARLLAELAYKRGAVVQDQSPDEVVCVFGLEVAGEDDVASAMQYCLDASELTREAGRLELDLRLGSRVGIVAQRRGDAIHIRGSGLDDARALAGGARPGRPLLSGGAGRLASAHYTFRELPARRHRSRRLRAFELVGPRSFADRARVFTERRGHFIGREAELAELEDLLARTREQDRRLVAAVRGPGGVGKSRLVAEFVSRHPEARLVAVAATQAGSQAPFSVVTELIQVAVGLPAGRGEEARGQLSRRLRGLLEGAGVPQPDIDRCIGTFEEAMELRDGALLRAVQTSADVRERVAAAIRRLRAAAPVALAITAIENIQWADFASLDVLIRVAAKPVTGAELVVMTTRPGAEIHGVAEHLEAIIDIDELPAAERDALIRDRLESDDEETIGLVGARAGGNPLLIEEVCTAVRELGATSIPTNASGIILARVDKLPLGARTALQHAAVAGPVVRTPILAELLGPHAPAYIDALIEEGLLVPSDFAAERGDASELRFRNGLLHEVVYDSLSAGARRSAHLQLGRLLAARAAAGRDERPAEVANHLELGGDREGAARFWIRAGDLAVAAFDAESARRAYSRTIELTAGSEGGARDLEVAALFGRERAAGLLGDHDDQARDQEALLERVVASADRAAELHWRIAARRLRVGDYAAAGTAAETAAELATAAGDDKTLGEALLVRGEILERTGDFAGGLAAVDRATEIFRNLGDREAEMRSLIVRGRNCLTRSHYRAAREAYEPVRERLEREPDPFIERIIHNHLAVIELCCGDFEAAMQSAQRSVTLCEELGDRARVGDNLSVCGIILAGVGQYRTAKDYLDRALAILEETQSRWSICDCRMYNGVCATLLGEIEPGFATLEEAVADARELGARYVLANALSELAGALLRRDRAGDAIRAEAAAREAHEIARGISLAGIEILALARHAEATVRLGNTMSAVALSARAVDMLDEHEGIEGSEEEVLYTHCQLLRRMGDPRAEDYLARARASLETKLERIVDPSWRRSFCDDVAVNAAILLET
jgi:serine/threonine protein kinase/predicted ATPase